MMARGAVVAVAGLRAVGPPEAEGTTVGANRPDPTRLAVAVARLLIAGAAVLTAAVRLAFGAVGADRAWIVAAGRFLEGNDLS